jgi:membrane protease YdiL (CAAX protease family)
MPLAGPIDAVRRGLTWLLGPAHQRTTPTSGGDGMLWWCCAWAAVAMFIGDQYTIKGSTPVAAGVFRAGVHAGMPLVAIALWSTWRLPRARWWALAGAPLMLAPIIGRVVLKGFAAVLTGDVVLTMVVPFLLAVALLQRGLHLAGADPSVWGMGLGRWRWWLPRVLVMTALVVPLCLLAAVLSPAMVNYYPMWKPARTDGGLLGVYFLGLFTGLYGWEVLWRGFLLNAFARRGDPLVAIFASAFPFYLLHYPKPDIEMLASFPGGLLAGWFCLHARSSLPMWIMHCVLFASMSLIGFYWR